MSRFPIPRLAPTVLLTASLMLTAAAAVAAQNAPSPGPGGRPGSGAPSDDRDGPGRDGDHRGPGPEGRRGGPGPDPVVFEGPPAPAEMKALLALTENAAGKYASLYANLMSTTRAQRDSLRTFRGERMAAVAKGEIGPGEGPPSITMRRLHLALAEKQELFDREFKAAVTPEQWQRYQTYREVRRQEAFEAMRQLHGAPGRGGHDGQRPHQGPGRRGSGRGLPRR